MQVVIEPLGHPQHSNQNTGNNTPCKVLSALQSTVTWTTLLVKDAMHEHAFRCHLKPLGNRAPLLLSVEVCVRHHYLEERVCPSIKLGYPSCSLRSQFQFSHLRPPAPFSPSGCSVFGIFLFWYCLIHNSSLRKRNGQEVVGGQEGHEKMPIRNHRPHHARSFIEFRKRYTRMRTRMRN